jgi:hypothetical protein
MEDLKAKKRPTRWRLRNSKPMKFNLDTCQQKLSSTREEVFNGSVAVLRAVISCPWGLDLDFKQTTSPLSVHFKKCLPPFVLGPLVLLVCPHVLFTLAAEFRMAET